MVFAALFGVVLALGFSPSAQAGETGQISGSVTGAPSKAALEGIEVCASTTSEELFGECATTNSTGEYTIIGLVAGEYTVEFSLPAESGLNYLSQYYDGESSASEAQAVPVAAGGVVPGIDAELQPAGQITGEVTGAPSNAPLEGIEVCASTTSKEFFERCATTNSKGEYTIIGLAAGEYTVEFSLPAESEPNYLSQYYDGESSASEAQAVPVAAGGVVPGIDAELQPAGQITGKVTGAPSKAALEGIEVCATTTSEEGFQRCAMTDATGEYTIIGLVAGEYTVEFSLPSKSGLNYLDQYYDGMSSLSEAQAVPIAAGGVVPGIDAELQPGGQITGKVTASSSKAAIERIEVCASPTTGGSKRCTSTNAKGEYTIIGLAAGEYTVAFFPGALDYSTQYYDGKSLAFEAQAVPVAAGGVVPGIDAELQPAGQITGKVTGAPSKAALEGIEVCATTTSEEGFQRCAMTDATGEYTIIGLVAGEYTVEFSLPPESKLNYLSQYYDGKSLAFEAQAVPVAAGGVIPGIDAELQPGGQITGTVTGAPSKAALEGIEVCVSTTIETEAFEYCATTDATGEYTIVGLVAGEYTVAFFPGALDYFTQYYDGKSSAFEAQAVPVAAGGVAPGIDAELQPVATQPESTALPTISGTPMVGSILSCSDGSWSGTPAPAFTYEWLREGSLIPGQTQSTYTVQAADEGHSLSCKVTATNIAGSASATSNTLTVAAKPAPITTTTTTTITTSTTSTTTTTSVQPPAPSGRVSLAGSIVTVQRGGKVGVKLTCTGTATCAGKLTLTGTSRTKKGKKSRTTTETIGTAPFSIPAGRTATISLALNGTGRALLRAAHGRLSAALTILKSAPSPATKQTKNVHLVEPRATKTKKSNE